MMRSSVRGVVGRSSDGPLDGGGIEGRLGAGGGVVEHGPGGVDVARRFAGLAVTHLRRHEAEPGRPHAGRHGGQGPAAESEVGDGAATGMAQHDAGGNDAAEEDALGVRVLQGAEKVARERVHGGNQPWAALRGVLEALAVDPVAHAVRDLADHADVVHMADRGMVELGQGLGLSQEPGARVGRRCRC